MYSLPEKRKRTNDNDNVDDDKEEHSQEENHSPPSVDKDSSFGKPGETDIMEGENSALNSSGFPSPEEEKRRNPFAKSQNVVTSKPSSGRQFSALKRFSKMKRTAVDQNTIVQSRLVCSDTDSRNFFASLYPTFTFSCTFTQYQLIPCLISAPYIVTPLLLSDFI